jgi:hypothetical protein
MNTIKTISVFIASIILNCPAYAASQSSKLFDVTLQDIPGGGRVLDIGFYKKPPSPKVIDKIVRQSLDDAILVAPSNDILAEAFIGDQTLNSDQYGGPLIYKARLKKIQKFWKPEQWKGAIIPSANINTNAFFTDIVERSNYNMSKKWIDATIVFPQKPNQKAAYDAIRLAAKKLVSRKEDINLYVDVGSKNEKTSWRQIKDTDGTYISADYNSATKKLMHGTKLLQQM